MAAEHYFKTEPYFEEVPFESKDFLAETLSEERTLNSVPILKLKKLNKQLLQKFLSTTKEYKSNLLKSLIEKHARAELYPNIKEQITLPNGSIM